MLAAGQCCLSPTERHFLGCAGKQFHLPPGTTIPGPLLRLLQAYNRDPPPRGAPKVNHLAPLALLIVIIWLQDWVLGRRDILLDEFSASIKFYGVFHAQRGHCKASLRAESVSKRLHILRLGQRIKSRQQGQPLLLQDCKAQ